MKAIDSLAQLVDRAHEVEFRQRPLPAGEALRLARAIAARQGVGYCYAGLCGLTERDRRDGVRLFTGERLAYSARARHVLGEESLRALRRLGVADPAVAAAVEAADAAMTPRLRRYAIQPGIYCCKTCAPSVWRALEAGAYPSVDEEAWVVGGVRALRACRDGNGRWRSFPHYYTLLALSGFDYPQVRDELRYALGSAGRRGSGTAPVYAERRRLLLERIAARCA